jgi:hypothetical protein
MYGKKVLVCVLVLCTSVIAFGQNENQNPTDKIKKIDVSLLTLNLTPGIEIPLETTVKDLMNLGFATDISGSLPFPFLPWVSPAAALSYSVIPVRADTSISILSLGLGGQFTLEIGNRFLIYATLFGGGYYAFFNEKQYDLTGSAYDPQQGGNPLLSAGIGVSFYLTPYLSVGLNGAYREYFGLYHGIRGSLGSSLHISGFQRQVRLHSTELEPVFPVFLQYYNSHGIGKAVLHNNERFSIKDIEVELFIKQYMDSPTKGTAPALLKPGEKEQVEFNTLFSDRLLELREGMKVPAEITVHYTMNGVRREYVTVEQLQLYHRNAMTWDDDRKAAAFVSAKDPEVLKFSKLVAGIVRNSGPASINQNLRMGIGLFEAISAYSLSYVIDPNTPSYIEASQDTNVLDFLQFPKQTLEYRGGDCDDLSILYCALLESIGIETAFITIPGHIYMAFSLDMKSAEALRTFTSDDLLIFHEGQTWIPVEVTKVGKGFSEAWWVGAKQWRDSLAKEAAGFYPLHQSWRLYESAGSPAEQVSIELPAAELVESAYTREVNGFVERELYPQIERLQAAIQASSDPIHLMNRLGVLYARYGLTNEAEQVFREILRTDQDYAPALINLGNIYYLAKDLVNAKELFEKVETTAPDNKVVLLNLARINYELKQYALVNKYYSLLKRQEPELGERFAYLGSTDSSASRADDIEGLEQRMIWEVAE